MKHLIIFIFGLVAIVSCNKSDRNDTQDETSQTINVDNLKGDWYLNKWTTYHTLMIDDSTIFVDNNTDTVFTLNYSVFGDTLKTWTAEKANIYKSKVLKLTSENLTLEGIAGIQEIRTYSQTKKEFENE